MKTQGDHKGIPEATRSEEEVMEKTLIGLRRKQPCLDFGLLASSPETQYISVVQATQLVGLGHRCSGR